MIRRHVRPETLARYNEGDLAEGRAGRISSHLARCARCAGVRDDLAQVPALLARTEVPPLPDHLAARIHTALAAESAAGSAPGVDGPDSAADRRGLQRRPEQHRAGAAGLRASARPAASPGRPPPPAARTAEPGGTSHGRLGGRGGRRWSWPRAAAVTRSSDLGSGRRIGKPSAQAAAVAPGRRRAAGAVIRLTARPCSTSTTASPARSPRSAPARTSCQVSWPRRLARHWRSTPERAAVAEAARPLGSPASVQHSTSTRAGGSLARVSLTGLAGCVSRVAAGSLVLLVDVAAYQSAPATVIVTAGSGQAPRQVWAGRARMLGEPQ